MARVPVVRREKLRRIHRVENKLILRREGNVGQPLQIQKI